MGSKYPNGTLAKIAPVGTTKRTCGVAECNMTVQRIRRHLTTVHGLAVGSEELSQALAKTKTVIDSKVSINNNPPVKIPFGDEAETTACNHTLTSAHDLKEVLKACCVDLQNTKENFLNHQFTLLGGARQERAAAQHVTQAFKFIDGVKSLHLTCFKSFRRCEHILTDDRTLRDAIEGLRNDEQKQKTRAPGTIASYLSSLQQYINFLSICHGTSLPNGALDRVQRTIRSAQRTVQKMKAERKIQLQAKITKELINGEDTARFLNSPARRRALCWLREPTAKLGKRRSAYVRNYILAEISLQSALRSGALSSMTLGEVDTAEKVKLKSGVINYVISVNRHKTSYAHGPAKVPLTAQVFKDLCTYIERVRPTGSSRDEDSKVFLTSNSKPLTSVAVSGAINSAWRKSGCRQKRVNATLIRKSIATKCFAKRPSLVEPFSALMAHTPLVHRTHYRQEMGPEQAAKIGTSLRRMMGFHCFTEPMDEDIEDDESDRAESPSSGQLDATVESDPTPLHDLTNPNTGSLFQTEEIDSENKRSHGRQALTSQDRFLLSSVFFNTMQYHHVSTSVLREVAQSNASVMALINQHGFSSVYESVRYLKFRLAHSNKPHSFALPLSPYMPANSGL